MNYLNLTNSYYFSETELKKILLEVLDSKHHPLILTLKRRGVVKEVIANKEKIIGKWMTQEQIDYLQKKKEKNKEHSYLVKNDLELIKSYFTNYQDSLIKRLQYDIIKVFLGIGLRAQELCDFEPGWVESENYRVKVLGKGKKWRWTHISEDTINLLLGVEKKYAVNQNEIFKNSYGNNYKPMFVNLRGKPFTPRHIQKFMETISNHLPQLSHKLHPHLLRHTYAVFRIMDNPSLSIEELRQDMGHEDINTTAGYFALAEAERIKMAKKRILEAESPVKKEGNKTRFCVFCGNTLPREAVFCSECGRKQ